MISASGLPSANTSCVARLLERAAVIGVHGGAQLLESLRGGGNGAGLGRIGLRRAGCGRAAGAAQVGRPSRPRAAADGGEAVDRLLADGHIDAGGAIPVERRQHFGVI